jgi:hypothetical protein
MNSCAKIFIITFFLFLPITGSANAGFPAETDTNENGINFNDLVYSPAHPYILAYTRTENHKRTLHLLNQQNHSDIQISRVEIASNGTLNRFFTGRFDQDKTGLDYYSGELHWRPILDARGRQWYMYVSSTSSGEIRLHINFLNREGIESGLDDIRYSFQGEIRNPRWSPDGRMITFSSRDQLYLLHDIIPVINNREVSSLSPIRLTQTGEKNQYPDWSPSGRHIAYQSTRTETGVRNSGIDIIPVDPDNPGRISIPVRVTSHMYNFNEYLPTWSPDENYIAYYINQDPLYLDQTSDKLDIGITQLFTNPGTGEIIGGRTGQVSTRRVATDVKAFNYSGPEWLYMDEGNPVTLSLLFLTDDNQGRQRIRYAQKSMSTSLPTVLPITDSMNQVHLKKISM